MIKQLYSYIGVTILQITVASVVVKLSAQSVPQTPFTLTSTRPS